MHRAIFQTRRASAATNPIPFPSHAHPTPHQIFHLPVGASQKEIKARYYDLVRAHHPDSPLCRHIPSDVRHARFRSITAAYDVLRGMTRQEFDPVMWEIQLRKRAMDRWKRDQMRRAAELGPDYVDPEVRWAAAAETDERWKDTVLIVFGALAVTAAISPVFWSTGVTDHRHRLAAANLARARREAYEVGEEQRKEVRKRVQKYREQEQRGCMCGEAADADNSESNSCNLQHSYRA